MPGLRARLRAQRARRRDAATRIGKLNALIRTRVAFLTQRPRLAAYLARRFNLRFTSGWRSVAHNAAVGGVPNSWHTKGTRAKPGAIDLVGAPGDMHAASVWAAEHLALAENLIHNVGSGRHLHLAGTAVMNWQHPNGGRLKRLRAKRARQRARRKDAREKAAALRRQIRAKPQPAKGIDVSSHQGGVDFRKVKAAGYAFVYVKATEGEDFLDARFHGNVRAARAAGLKVGAYHYLRPRPGRTGAAEVKDFVVALKAAGLGKGDLVPALDIEETDLPIPATLAYVRGAADALKRHIGREPVIYTFPAFLREWPAAFAKAPLWIANINVAKPTIPKPWTRCAAWQHSFTGRVPGVTGNVDLNRTPDLKELLW